MRYSDRRLCGEMAADRLLSSAVRSSDDGDWPVHSFMSSLQDLCSLPLSATATIRSCLYGTQVLTFQVPNGGVFHRKCAACVVVRLRVKSSNITRAQIDQPSRCWHCFLLLAVKMAVFLSVFNHTSSGFGWKNDGCANIRSMFFTIWCALHPSIKYLQGATEILLSKLVVEQSINQSVNFKAFVAWAGRLNQEWFDLGGH